MAGISNIRYLSKELGLDLEKSPEARAIVREVKKLESEGYEFEGADASFALLVMRHTGKYRKLFDILEYRVFCEQFDGRESVWATIKMRVNDTEQFTVNEGDGPVHALDGALRLALRPFYPHLNSIKLTDFKVRVVNVREATAAKVRVLVQSSDGQRDWTTIGVSTNIIAASLRALVEGIEYGLLA